MPPPDFFRPDDAAVAAALSEAQAAALLASGVVRRPRGVTGSVLVEASHVARLGRRALPPPPLDQVTVSVSRPLVHDEGGDLVAGVLFRRANHVVPGALGDGIAEFGEDRFEDIHYYEPPLAGSVMELTFVPPRPRARYLVEFRCFGDSVTIEGNDGTSLISRGSLSVVHYSARRQVTYALRSEAYWWFASCSIRWMTG